MLDMLLREIAFRTLCRHQQGDKPNILLYCSRRGGSTWLLNTLAAHPGMRYVGRPFLTILRSRWRNRLPDLASAAGYDGNHQFRQIVHFTGNSELQFRKLARDIIESRIHIYPSLAFREPYFHRNTDRIVFQMTSGMPLIGWFDRQFTVNTAILFRHPIPTALSIMRENDPPECNDFLLHPWFIETHLNQEQYNLARWIMDSGSPREQHVLDWTLKMLVPYQAILSGDHPDWLTLTYEQTVINPELVIRNISYQFALPNMEKMTRTGPAALSNSHRFHRRSYWRPGVHPPPMDENRSPLQRNKIFSPLPHRL